MQDLDDHLRVCVVSQFDRIFHLLFLRLVSKDWTECVLDALRLEVLKSYPDCTVPQRFHDAWDLHRRAQPCCLDVCHQARTLVLRRNEALCIGRRDLCLNNKYISRRHLRILKENSLSFTIGQMHVLGQNGCVVCRDTESTSECFFVDPGMSFPLEFYDIIQVTTSARTFPLMVRPTRLAERLFRIEDGV